MGEPPKFSDLRIIKDHPMGLFIAIIILGLIFIYRGAFSCLIKVLIRLPFNIKTPENILQGGICDPNKMFQIRLGEFLLNLLKNPWFYIPVLIMGFIIYYYLNKD